METQGNARRAEHARFFTTERFDSLECVTAVLLRPRFTLHAHDTYTIGNIHAGHGWLGVRGRRHDTGPEHFLLHNPGDVHDGHPDECGIHYRNSYPSIALLRQVASEVSGRRVTDTPFFPTPVVRDPDGIALFLAAHRALDEGRDTLAADELLSRAYAHCLVRHAAIVPAGVGDEGGPVARAGALMQARYAEDVGLSDLAAVAGLSAHHLIRAFRRHTGFTPHAFLVNRRVNAARHLLRQRGASLADVAAATGFCDQAHFTRAFKARVGVTPGSYRAAVAA